MKAKIDRRSQYTRNAIKDAFLALLEKNHFDSISVAAVCREADVGRSTFYSHYDTLMDVIDELADDAIQATVRPEGNPFDSIHELAALLQKDTRETDELNSLIQQSTSFIFISYDKSTESIFSTIVVVDH